VNVLLTAAGRRSYLVRYFQAALKGRGAVVAANSEALSPAMQCADRAVVLPASYHDEYPDAVVETCRTHEIGLVCSCHDLDVLALSSCRERIRATGAEAMVPDPDWARACLDKLECGRRLGSLGFDTPWATTSLEAAKEALKSGIVSLPLLVKARLGFGSLALGVCETEAELEWSFRRATNELAESVVDRFVPLAPDERVLVQEHVAGPEYCLDVVNDLAGREAAQMLCEVHSMRAGESDAATTVDPALLGDLPRRFARATRHLGIWGVDLRVGGGSPVILDVNPRFTGDYPFQQLAGADVPAALVAWVEGREPEAGWLSPAFGVRGFKDLVPRRCSTVTDARV
jgi:carbamoyl-phosphate synthase large subunit